MLVVGCELTVKDTDSFGAFARKSAFVNTVLAVILVTLATVVIIMNSQTDARRDSWQDELDDFDADPPAWEHAALLIESHRRQFVGEDYQAVAQDLCDRIKNPTTEDFLALSSSPDPDCGCDFCRSAEW